MRPTRRWWASVYLLAAALWLALADLAVMALRGCSPAGTAVLLGAGAAGGLAFAALLRGARPAPLFVPR